MINITDKVQCCGCNACGDICPKDAITFRTDIEGFWYPEVNKDKCIDCGLCEKTCPVIHKEEWHKSKSFEKPDCFAAVHKNIEIRFDSTSGGAFSALAEEIYKQGGYVGGAIYNEDWSVSQFLSSEKSDLPKLRSSKYQQSHFEGFYIAVKKALRTNKPVLVCGSPCQMAALKRYLLKPYDNLIVVDYICRGIASPLLFKQYINYLEKKHNSKVVYYKAKNKELGWRELTSKIIFENKDVEYQRKDENPWMLLNYATPEVVRPSCFECPFKGFPRTSDITIGDLWTEADAIPKNLDGDLGTSVILINNEHGRIAFETIKKKLNVISFPLEKAFIQNRHLLKPIVHSQTDRTKLFKNLNNSLEACIKEYLPDFQGNRLTPKRKIKNAFRFLKAVTKASGLNLNTWIKNIRYNFLSKQVQTNIFEQKYIIIHKNCIINIEPKAQLILNAPFIFGCKRVKGSSLESRLLIENGAKMIIKNGYYSVSYGADIEVFRNATLEIGGNAAVNIGLTIVCGNRISIGQYTGGGRNVTIRDNNGEHFISIRGYKTSIPVTIKEHVWLTESCTIMPGAIIDTGAIISAHSVVSGHIPNFCIAKGNPAQVVEKDIYWKN